MRTMLSAALALAMWAPAHADVTINATNTGKGLGMSGTTTSTTYIKGLKMRVDNVRSKKTDTTIFDVENQKMYVLNAKKKEVDVWDMGAFSEELSKSVATEGMQSSISPNGQTKTIAGHAAEGYDMKIVVPATLGGPGGMTVTMVLSGVTWIVKGVPGTEEFATFYKGAAEKGWIFTDPRAAKGSPGQAKAMAEMHAEFAKLGGVPYESNIDIDTQGDGVMGGLMARLGGVTMTTVTESVETAPLSDDLFLPPADYTLKQQ
ncbi:MAG: hypothetical protein M3O07_01950 [Pseudomonadota bacterium]|nr:hypothetical protein [Pseudomonadota bacterium]